MIWERCERCSGCLILCLAPGMIASCFSLLGRASKRISCVLNGVRLSWSPTITRLGISRLLILLRRSYCILSWIKDRLSGLGSWGFKEYDQDFFRCCKTSGEYLNLLKSRLITEEMRISCWIWVGKFCAKSPQHSAPILCPISEKGSWNRDCVFAREITVCRSS